MRNHRDTDRRDTDRRDTPARRHRSAAGTLRTTRSRSLAPLWRERWSTVTRPGWSRTVHARRAVAAGLVMLAAVLAVRGDPSTASTDVVVAVHDLRPGQVVGDSDVRKVALASGSVPAGAIGAPAEVTGRTVAGAVRAGEPITDVRVLGPSLAALATGSTDATSVPLRLTDPDVADLLRPGDAVTVLVLGERAGDVRALARDAVVLVVQPTSQRRGADGRLVVLGLPAAEAASVAAASLESTLTVTFR